MTTGDWTIGNLAFRSTVTLAITARVVGSGPMDNRAEVSGVLQLDRDHSNDHATVRINVPPAADLSVAKTVDNAAPDKGTNVTFSVTVANNGPDATAGVHVGDKLPDGLTYDSSSPSVGTYDPATGDWVIGDMANGAVQTLSVTATVEVEGPIANTAQVTASSLPDPNSTPNNNDPSENDQSSAHLNSYGQADLSLTKVATPTALHKGDQTTYTIVVANHGPDGATGVVVRDQLPAEVTYVSSAGGTYNPTTGAWTVGNLANGSSATLTITVRVGGTGSIINAAAVVASDQRDPNLANGRATAGVAVAGATLPPTLMNDTLGVAREPGLLALWVLGFAFAGFAIMGLGARATRNRRFITIRRWRPPGGSDK